MSGIRLYFFSSAVSLIMMCSAAAPQSPAAAMLLGFQDKAYLRSNKDGTGWFAGTNWEYSLVGHEFSESRAVLELRVIAGYKADNWLFAMNPVFDWNMPEGYRSIDPEFTASFKLTHKIIDGLYGGVEYYGDIGKPGRVAPLEQQDQRLYAVIDVDMEPYVFNLGIGRGFTRQADEWTIKAIIEVPVEQISKSLTGRSGKN